MYEDNILFSSVIKHHVFTVQITMYVPFKGQNMQGTWRQFFWNIDE